MASLKKLLQTKPGTDRGSNPNRVVIGLRNPGPDYEGTRHNSGYEVLARVLERAGEKLGRGPSRVRAQITQVGSGDSRLLYAVPMTYMNESGRAVRALLDYFGLSPQSILVVHDDIDLPFGRLRLQVGGGTGGNNGVRSIETALGTRDFSRLKIGVGRPPGQMDPADFVLRPFTKAERSEVELMIEDAADVIEVWPIDPDRAQEMAALRGRERS
ncbi:MAG TPA: aminoacyl-tRNA hydrolase [Acidimicrobiia bacterium]|nr:aminoacyl-tRNA hydrolase [Acidimicrobiia bacterium]